MEDEKSVHVSDIVTFNVGGTLFSTQFSTLASLPDTRLGRLATGAAEYIAEKDYFFFDRNPICFQCILDLYRHGNLHVPANVCGATLRRELEFWQIPLNKIPTCCLAILCKHEDNLDSMERLKSAFAIDQDQLMLDQESKQSMLSELRRVIWLFMTSRNSSRAAKVFNILFYIMASLSVFIFVLETHPEFRDPYTQIQELKKFAESWINYYNGTTSNDTFKMDDDLISLLAETNPKKIMFFETYLKIPLKRIDQVCVFFFTVDLFIRLLTCPSLFRFIKNVLNILDIIIIMSLLIAFGLECNPTAILSSETVFWLFVICKSMVILRIVRLFRLANDIGGLKVLLLAVKATFKELLLLGASVLIIVVLFSAVIYYVEFEQSDSSFSNIPITIWWSLITVTTVGYGDITPTTYLGYIIAGLCAVCGILLVAMPIAIVASTFSELSFLNRVRERKEEMDRSVESAAPQKQQTMFTGILNKIHAIKVK